MIKVNMRERTANDRFSIKNPLSCLLYLFSLSTNSRRELNSNSHLSVIKIVITGVLFCVLTVLSIYYRINKVYSDLTVSVRLTDLVQAIYDYFQFNVDLYFVYKYGRRYYQEYYKQYTTIDQVLGECSCSPIRAKINKLVFLFASFWVAVSAVDCFVWVSTYGWMIPFAFSLTYIYLLLKILTNLDFTYQTMHIEVRLGIMRNLILTQYLDCDSLSGATSDPVENKNWFYCNSSSFKRREFPKNSHSGIQWLSRCYLLLIEQSRFINQKFGFRVRNHKIKGFFCSEYCSPIS
ncbi:uncharacterized protein LOC135075583 [Ostrinia nubilalis]|uniref:uncharacterized protein LOC135075583 n=1 Tax=Ostrinia nubilalis TaxID=29057 RepID=UPI00308264D5